MGLKKKERLRWCRSCNVRGTLTIGHDRIILCDKCGGSGFENATSAELRQREIEVTRG